MAVSKCSHCRTPFWKYAPSPNPAGYCSQICFDGRKKKGKRNPGDEDAQIVAMVNRDMRKHYLEVHKTTDLTEWFDCETCQSLDRRKTEALAEVV